MKSRASRSCAIGLVALTAVLTATSTAGAWSRPADFAVSSPAGGEFQVCRDGIKFQIAAYGPALWQYKAYSPPAQFDPNGAIVGTVVAEGEVNLQPSFPILPEQFTHIGTAIRKWNGGQLLQPSPDVLNLDLKGYLVGLYDIDDCYLFPPKNKSQCRKGGWRRWGFKNQGRCIAYVKARAREACIDERTAGPEEFRMKYGRRQALRRCVRETT